MGCVDCIFDHFHIISLSGIREFKRLMNSVQVGCLPRYKKRSSRHHNKAQFTLNDYVSYTFSNNQPQGLIYLNISNYNHILLRFYSIGFKDCDVSHFYLID